MTNILFRTRSLLWRGLALAALIGCGGHADVGQQAASPELRGLGIDSYVLVEDGTAGGNRYEVTFFDRAGAAIGELAQEPDGAVRFSLGGHSLVATRQDAAMLFTLDGESATLTLDGNGQPTGDAAAMALWQRAAPTLDSVSRIATALKLRGAATPGVTVAAASASCHQNPMYISGVYINVFCPFNRVASCQSWMVNNCPFGRVCSNDSHPGDCFRGLEACGGYCDCSTFGTLCNQNSDCCSNHCLPPGGKFHLRTCGQ